MLTYLTRIFLCKIWVILILCTALGNISYVHGSPKFRFRIEPSDVVVVAGRSVTLDCQVEVPDDSTEVTIRWRGDDDTSYFNERDPKRTVWTNGSLHIPHVTAEEQGNYQCVANIGTLGSMASRKAKIQVAGPPSLETQPQDLRVFPQQTAHFSCMMHGPLKYSVTWLKDDRPLSLDHSRMVVMPSGSLEIDEVDSSDQGSYRCNASSSGIYKLSNKAVLTMDADLDASSNVMAPIFITKPKSTVVREGDTVVLDCAANGFPRPWIIWLKDGVAIDFADSDSRFSKLGRGSLQIVDITEKDAGNYQCRAENREDSLDEPANIEVQVPPKFSKTPQDTIAYEKQDVELSCQVEGKPEPKIEWLKNGERITLNDYLQFVNGYNLKILGLMKMDAGIFQCTASNSAGNIQAAARLTVLQSGSNLGIINPGKGVGNSEPGKRLPFPLKADEDISTEDYDENDDLEYDDDEDDEEDDGDDEDEDYDSLLPSKTNITKSKTYKPPKKFGNSFKKSPQSVSSNNLGTSNPSTEPGTVDLVPSAPRDLQALFVSSRSVTLRLVPPAHTNGEITSYSVFFRQEGSQRERVLNTSGARLEEITIPGLQPDRTYHFRVVANNAIGAGVSSDDLEVKTETEIHVPSSPLAIQAYATSPTSILIEWKPPSVTNGPILQYKLFYLESDSSDEKTISTSELSVEVSDLKKFTEYCFWVIAINENGMGSASEEVIVRTLSDVPSEPPQNVTVEASSSTNVVVRWEPPRKDGQNGIITGYKLRYKKQNRRERGDGSYTVSAAGDRRLYILSDLDKGTMYQIRMWAMNVNGTGPPTDWIPVETFNNDLDETHVPDKPTNLIARASSNSIRVSWGPPKDPNIMVRGYTIGWGKGYPYAFSEILEGKQRTFNIERLEINSEYVIAVRAYNLMGDGQPAYVSVRTREEPPPEHQFPLLPPVGLKAVVLSPSSVILHWTDTTRSQVPDERTYSVRYMWAHHSNPRPKYVTTTTLNCVINDLRPNTQYEFSVKLLKGRRESKWSMVVFNTTFEAIPSSAPRDLTVVPVEKNPTHVNLNWQPPKQANGLITGYVIVYTTDYELPEKDWIPQNIVGDKLTAVIKGLNPSTTYYFKIQARNSKGYGPLSNKVSFTTGEGPAASHENSLFGKDGRPLSKMIYIILACSLFAILCVATTIGIICCKRASARQRNASGYLKGNLKPKTNMKPPDLWIHHDQMELKALEKTHHSNSDLGPSSSRSQMNTLGRNGSSQQNDLDHTNSLDKRTYLPSYVGSSSSSNQEKTSTIKRTVKPKPISLPMESQPIAQPVMTSTTTLTQSPGSELGRPLYPRTQYRAHITLDSNSSALENPYSLQSGYDSIGSIPPTASILPNSTAYSGGVLPSTNQNTLSSQNSLQPPLTSSAIGSGEGNGTLGKRQQGHPLKSFSVPAPPPQSAPGTPQQKHMVRPMQGSSPYKKPGPHGIIGTGSPSNTKLRSGPGTAEETTRLQPSYSTEELNQEMANLEGLMKDLNAITASEFEC